ncbi:hypothetical protein KSS87_013220, partial [Heliosperma pusillum]
MYAAESMLHPHIKSAYVNSLHRCEIFENGCRKTTLNIEECRPSIQSLRRWCKITSRSCYTENIKQRSFV